MLVASKPKGPAWTPVMAAKVLFDPIDRSMMRRARRAALKALQRPDEDDADAVEIDPAEQLEELGDALSYALILEGTRDWQDVAIGLFDDAGDPVLDDAGNPVFEVLPFSRDNLALLLSDPVIFDAFDSVYVMPFAQRERVKNGFAASPNGTGVAAMPGADTASSAAPPTAIAPAGAASARTPSTKPKRKRRTVSGRS